MRVTRSTPASERPPIARLGLLALAVLAIAAWPCGARATGRTSGPSRSAILHAGLIVEHDVPAGWTSAPAPKNPELLRIDGVAACSSTRAALNAANRRAARAFSRKFVAPDQIGAAQDVVFVAQNDQGTQSFLGAYAGLKGRDCVEAVANQIAKQTTGTAAVMPLTDLNGIGDQALGFEFRITAPNNGAQVTGISDLVLVRVGRAVVGFQFQNAIQPLPDRIGIVGSVATRLRALSPG